ncbi:hypothetical protein CONPUDRAFT_159654 [Coniophora puteana RWD-64-598 SS2]|uniref:Uncharacterized protein n=1 Tax=Coniophora puteana (strain RWD-64-598) TaxID=741705 RepID=A0A5M3M6A7_CONPW|nr:uncharacterized protein CONPUDRAFT_159654 [Coniophora puteana RWD-64-598 SS2]EIW74878.1 hypothetical protein CONPUDRAFT_159654 [Coniophora puteana RWD-64-598 SS2]
MSASPRPACLPIAWLQWMPAERQEAYMTSCLTTPANLRRQIDGVCKRRCSSDANSLAASPAADAGANSAENAGVDSGVSAGTRLMCTGAWRARLPAEVCGTSALARALAEGTGQTRVNNL